MTTEIGGPEVLWPIAFNIIGVLSPISSTSRWFLVYNGSINGTSFKLGCSSSNGYGSYRILGYGYSLTT
jgi:hypothetical protein